jgi:hypothetical protein
MATTPKGDDPKLRSTVVRNLARDVVRSQARAKTKRPKVTLTGVAPSLARRR